jgi:hypothetical protein
VTLIDLLRAAAIIVGLLAWPVTRAAAQPRPLPIESVAVAGAGNVSLETSLDYMRNTQFTLSGLKGNLWRFGLLRLEVGLSSIADFEISGGLRDHLAITASEPAVLSNVLRLADPTSTGAFDDLIVGTKVQVVREQVGRIGLAVQMATRLPNAKHPSGLGQDTTDFYSRLIIGRSTPALQLTGNIGFGILADPLLATRHLPSLLYNASISRPVTLHASLIAAVDGRTGPEEPGLESRGIGRLGMAWRRGPTRIELDGTIGLSRRDGTVGFAVTTGFIFHAFVP